MLTLCLEAAGGQSVAALHLLEGSGSPWACGCLPPSLPPSSRGFSHLCMSRVFLSLLRTPVHGQSPRNPVSLQCTYRYAQHIFPNVCTHIHPTCYELTTGTGIGGSMPLLNECCSGQEPWSTDGEERRQLYRKEETIPSCRSNSSWQGSHSYNFPQLRFILQQSWLSEEAREKSLDLANASLLWFIRQVLFTEGGQTSTLTDHSVTNSVIWNCVSVLACVCVCVYCIVGEVFLYNSDHIYGGVRVCVCVCLSLPQGKKVECFFNLWKSQSAFSLNDGCLLCAHNSTSQFLRSLTEDIQREWVTLRDRLLCMFLTVLGSEPSGQRSLNCV